MYYPSSFGSGLQRFLILLGTVVMLSSPVAGATDQLKGQPSAFLQSYAGGPVAWMPWGEAALARAKTEQKPVLLVIGNFTSELGRAMNRQTFSNQETAAFLNETFVCILVDAKERKDVAALYQQYLQNVKQLTGLPMNIWLTPELKPFDGANYLPPTEEWGKEGFNTVAKRAAAAWKADPAAQRAKAEEAVATVLAAQTAPPSTPLTTAELKQTLTDATEAWRARFDATNGGFGDPPKYPEPELLRFLLRDPASKDMALTTLHKIVHGAIHDPLDGGFFRYSVDAEWHHPYFQKTLPDQARLALALLDALQTSGDAQFGEAARGALTYATSQLRLPNGDFAASEDSTTDAATAAHLWTSAEIVEVLGEPAAKEFAAAYSVTAEGNIPADAFPGATTAGKNILYRSAAANAATLNEKSIRDSAAKLLAKRQKRSAALRDDNATAGMHGLFLEALSRAGAELKDSSLSAAAKAEYGFIRRELLAADSKLQRFAGRKISAGPDDYALIVSGLRAYAEKMKEAEANQLAATLLDTAGKDFADAPTGRYFTTRAALEPGFWTRVFSPASTAADLPSIESTILLSESQKAGSEISARLSQIVAAEVKEAAEVARGDLLLALSSASPAK